MFKLKYKHNIAVVHSVEMPQGMPFAIQAKKYPTEQTKTAEVEGQPFPTASARVSGTILANSQQACKETAAVLRKCLPDMHFGLKHFVQ